MRILAIGAHFDDVELGCGGTLLRHAASGDEISILVVTHSGYESKSKKVVRLREEALREGEASAAALGARLLCCEQEPLQLVPSESLVLLIEDYVTELKPDRVYTHGAADTNGDHAAVGYVSMRACRKCDQVLTYRSNWYIASNGHEDVYYVDVTAQMPRKLDLIRIFESEMRAVNYSWLDFVAKQNSAAGAKIGVDYAETFSVVKMVMR